MVRTLVFYILYYPITILCLLVGVPLSLLHRGILRNIASGWAQVGLFLAGIRVRVRGLENIPPADSLVFMANHQSNFDIPLLLTHIPRPFGFLAKIELFRIPLFNWGMYRMNCIPIDRANRQAAVESLKQAAAKMHAGQSVMVFPEGTRSPDGALLPFKKGGFQLALQAGVPIVPVAINGTFNVMNKKTHRIKAGAVELQVFPPIDPTPLTEAEIPTLMETVRSQIASALPLTGRLP